MKVITWFKGLFTKKEDVRDFDRMQRLINYKSEIDYFDRIKLAKKMQTAQDIVKDTVEDDWFTINWSMVSKDVKRRCIELAKEDIKQQFNLID